MRTIDFTRALHATLTALLMSGCGGESLRPTGDALKSGELPAQRFAIQTLTEGAIHVEVPAGEWRALRVQGLDTRRFYIASQPALGAKPWFGIGNGPEISIVSFTAPPSDRPYATEDTHWFRGLSGGDDVIVLGSNNAATRFSVGYAAPDFDLTSVGVFVNDAPTLAPEVAEALALTLTARPAVAARFESGVGGYAGTIYRQRLFEGGELFFVSGDIDLMESRLASADPGVEVLREYLVTGRGNQPERGAASFIALALLHSGAVDYDYNYALPPFAARQVGGGAGAGGFGQIGTVRSRSFAVIVPDLAGATDIGVGSVANVLDWTEADPGEGLIDLRFRFSGREAITALPDAAATGENLVRAFTPDIYWVDWGYASIDLATLYGWEMSRPEN